MKIDVNKIPPEGWILSEDIEASQLDLETLLYKFKGPVRVRAEVSRITNAVTVKLNLNGRMLAACSRCLATIDTPLDKEVTLNYAVEKEQQFIELDPRIREEIILLYRKFNFNLLRYNN